MSTGRAGHGDDKVAEERGLVPLRLPTLSTAFIPLRGLGSRKLITGALLTAGVCAGFGLAAILWARGAIADAEQRVARLAPKANADDSAAAVMDEMPVAKPTESSPSAITPTAGTETATTAPAVATGTCTLTIRASSDGATVWLDGSPRGAAPQTISGMCGSNANVEIRHPRYATFKREVVLGATPDTTQLDAKLERDKTELTVWSQPAGAEVTYDGHVIGKTPLTTTVNRFEQGRLEFRAPGYDTDWRRIMPKDAKKTVSITLKGSR